MHRVLVVGVGKIGQSVASLLHHSGDYAVCVADRDAVALQRLAARLPVQTAVVDVHDEADLATLLAGCDAVISALSFEANPAIARAALAAGASYFDLTEDVATTRAIRDIAGQAVDGQVFMPQCGLAPGFICILAHHMCQGFDQIEKVKMRVGALPCYPSNMMLYNLTWSTDGLINEYCNPCEVIRDGRRQEALPLEGLESFSLDGIQYEAFNTSGGLGTLCETLDGRVRSLNYKTVRYEGHQYLMAFLIKSLDLGRKRHLLKQILEEAVPITKQDVVLIFCTVSGRKEGQLVQESDARKIYQAKLYGETWSSIQVTTAAGVSAVVDMHFCGQLPATGFVRQEDTDFRTFMANRFGRHFAVAERVAEAGTPRET